MTTTPTFGTKWFCSLLASAIVLMALGAGSSLATAQEIGDDYPDQAIELVVPYAPGGGSDNMARTITAILQEEGITDATINVVNREGGSGTVGWSYTVSQDGDNYTLQTMTSGLLTTAIVLDTDVSYVDFTPIARLAFDQLLIVVQADSPFATIEDLIEAGTAEPDQVSWGGTGLGGEDSLLLAELEQASGANLNYISFESGGEVQAALLGGHVDVASANPNEILGQLEAGELRALAVAGEERLPGLPDVPTLMENDYDAVYEQVRGILGPPNMDPAAVQYWADVLQQLSESERWQTDYIEQNMLRSAYLPGEEFGAWMTEESARVGELITGMGLAPEE